MWYSWIVSQTIIIETVHISVRDCGVFFFQLLQNFFASISQKQPEHMVMLLSHTCIYGAILLTGAVGYVGYIGYQYWINWNKPKPYFGKWYEWYGAPSPEKRYRLIASEDGFFRNNGDKLSGSIETDYRRRDAGNGYDYTFVYTWYPEQNLWYLVQYHTGGKPKYKCWLQKMINRSNTNVICVN